jgi:hypothetical protein
VSALPPVAPVVSGETVVLEALDGHHAAELAELDWQRALHPGMAGPLTSGHLGTHETLVARSRATGEAVAVLDATELFGYEGVRSVSIYADADRSVRGVALEAYGRFVLHQLDSGARLVHHEVLELNEPIQRIFAALGLEVTARLRSHAYVAGRFWDVLVYSYDRPQLDAILARVFPRGHRGSRAVDHVHDENAGGTFSPDPDRPAADEEAGP